MNGHRFGQILYRLCFARSGRSFGGSAVQQINGSNHGAVATIREGCDHETHRVPQVLIPIETFGIHNTCHHRRLTLLGGLSVLPRLRPVIPKLGHPLEIHCLTRTDLDHLGHHVTVVYIYRRERTQGLALQLLQSPSDKNHHVLELLVESAQTLFESCSTTCVECLGDLFGPEHARDTKDHLCWPIQDPILAVDTNVLCERSFCLGANGKPLNALKF